MSPQIPVFSEHWSVGSTATVLINFIQECHAAHPTAQCINAPPDMGLRIWTCFGLDNYCCVT